MTETKTLVGVVFLVLLVVSSDWVSVVTVVEVIGIRKVFVSLVVSVSTQVVLVQIGLGDKTYVTVVVAATVVFTVVVLQSVESDVEPDEVVAKVAVNVGDRVELLKDGSGGRHEAEKVLVLVVTTVGLRLAVVDVRELVEPWEDVKFRNGTELSGAVADADALLPVRVSVIVDGRLAVPGAVGLKLAVELDRG